MNQTHQLKKIAILALILSVTVFCLVPARADAINEKKILRKAGGVATGTLSNVVITTNYAAGSLSTQRTSFDRTGSVTIPAKSGKAQAAVEHGGPEEGLDTTGVGKVSKATVKRGGKLIKYKGVGTMNPVLDSLGAFSGVVSATSKIRGKKVTSSSILSASRTLSNGDVENVTAVATGTSKF